MKENGKSEGKRKRGNTDYTERQPGFKKSHNVSDDKVENTNGTNQWSDVLFANKSRRVPRRIERILQRNNRKKKTSTIHWLTHAQGEQNETKNVAIDNKKYNWELCKILNWLYELVVYILT